MMCAKVSLKGRFDQRRCLALAEGPTACRHTALGTDYMGTRSWTVSGKTCQAWASQTPHEHTNNVNDKFPYGSAALAGNYCRNPDSDPLGPWCYTTDRATRWERCDIDVCSRSKREYLGGSGCQLIGNPLVALKCFLNFSKNFVGIIYNLHVAYTIKHSIMVFLCLILYK